MIKLFGTFVFFSVFLSSISAQFHDRIWMTGYDVSQNSSNSYGVSQMSVFQDSLDVLFMDENDFDFYLASTVICDDQGELLFYSNGLEIQNANHDTMPGSKLFNDHYRHETWYGTGLPVPEGVLALPTADSTFVLLYTKVEVVDTDLGWSGAGLGVHYSLIRQIPDTKECVLVKKDRSLFVDTVQQGGVVLATKHANGRDWWVLTPNFTSNVYNRLLVMPDTILVLESQEIGQPLGNGLMSASFSPDGHWYARGTISDIEDDRLDLYRFNRETGLLSDHRVIFYHENDHNREGGGGVAFSPNSRYLYVTESRSISQFDLWAPNIEDSQIVVAVYDGFTEYIPNAHTPTTFFLAWSAPDGKIYVITDNSTGYFHIIHNPNQRGVNCNVEQHPIHLESSNNRTIPNHPNYRLGPIDGSASDTLGIDNIPLAGWRKNISGYEVEFIDVSWYEPETWHWTFGDGQVSADTNPTHTYLDTGYYEVCLTVSNSNGADTLCKWIHVLDSISSVFIPFYTDEIKVYPNPASEAITLQSESPLSSDYRWELYSSTGALVHTESVVSGETTQTIRLIDMASGLYFWRLSDGEHHSESRKLVIMEDVE